LKCVEYNEDRDEKSNRMDGSDQGGAAIETVTPANVSQSFTRPLSPFLNRRILVWRPSLLGRGEE
jgi:hypothetical protein